MKKIVCTMLVAALIMSCSTDGTNSTETNARSLITKSGKLDAVKLSQNETFLSWANTHYNLTVKLAIYQNSVLGLDTDKVTSFKEAIGQAKDADETEVVLRTFGLDIDTVNSYQMAMHQAQLDMFYGIGQFDGYDEVEVDAAMQEALILAYQNGTILTDPALLAEIQDQYATYGGTITAPELWDCIKQSVTCGVISVITMKGLAAAGVTIITKTLTRMISKFAGPLGVAIMIADFTFCLMGAAED